MRRRDVALWPIATNFSLGPDVGYRGKSGSAAHGGAALVAVMIRSSRT